MATDIEYLQSKVIQAAKNGRAISIFAMLWNQDRETVVNEVLNKHSVCEGLKTTPLIVAARNGQEKVVTVLLKNFNVDIEQTGTVKFDGYTIEGATPLWCAAGAGHLGIVRMLVEAGADVNHATVTNSTPLRAACFDGRLDIVKYLLENKADLTIANKYRNTCLMISCYKGHKEVAKHLLESGAPTDSKAHCGATALHFAAECGHVEIVNILLQHEAAVLPNDSRMTPLLVAAECCQAGVVEYMITNSHCDKKTKITALELLGASFANDKEQYNVQKAYDYLLRGMKERFKEPDDVIKKEPMLPVPAYGFHNESQTVEELERLELNSGALHMEGLAVRERILGMDNAELLHPIVYRGAVFADGGRFNRCIHLWLHALQLRQRNKRSVCKDLLRFAQVFSQMVHLETIPDLLYVEDVFLLGVKELDYDLDRLVAHSEDEDNLYEVYEENIHTLLYLAVIMDKLHRQQSEPNNDVDIHKAVYKFLKHKPKLRNGYTPLHMVNDAATIVDDFHVNDVVTFPSGDACKLLLSCGADPNIQDKQGNTPLHLIVQYLNPVEDFDNLHTCIVTLISAGVHIDTVNKNGKTALQAANTGVSEIILRTNNKISLKCIAARMINTHDIPYKGQIPSILEEFIELH